MRAVSTAVILAAGLGTRLGQLGQQLPKGFLQLDGLPIVEQSILRLRQAGMSRIVIVTGHLSEFYLDLQTRYPKLIETVHNPRYAESGSMASLWAARQLLAEDFLLLESDLIYEPRALVECLEFPRENAVLLSGPTDSHDEVFVGAQDGHLRGMSKDRGQVEAEILGELVGISKISRVVFQTMLEVSERHGCRGWALSLSLRDRRAGRGRGTNARLLPSRARSGLGRDRRLRSLGASPFAHLSVNRHPGSTIPGRRFGRPVGPLGRAARLRADSRAATFTACRYRYNQPVRAISRMASGRVRASMGE